VFQPDTFGYVGQPSHGHAGLATLYHASADFAVTPRVWSASITDTRSADQSRRPFLPANPTQRLGSWSCRFGSETTSAGSSVSRDPGASATPSLRRRDPEALRLSVDEHGRRLYRAARGMARMRLGACLEGKGWGPSP
jgi:hypothetical protein